MTFSITLEDGEFLVKLARRAVEEYLKNEKKIKAPGNTPAKLMVHCGVFVTVYSIKMKKKLRGCIGFPYPNLPLANAVIESAINSSSQDPRFHPISSGELDHIVFEVSVLTPPQLIELEEPTDYPLKVIVGQDGLIIERDYNRGLLLPQVPVEWGWNEEEFLCQCCIKAGLSPDGWLLKGTKVYKFQALIFEEVSPKGEIKAKELHRK